MPRRTRRLVEKKIEKYLFVDIPSGNESICSYEDDKEEAENQPNPMVLSDLIGVQIALCLAGHNGILILQSLIIMPRRTRRLGEKEIEKYLFEDIPSGNESICSYEDHKEEAENQPNPTVLSDLIGVQIALCLAGHNGILILQSLIITAVLFTPRPRQADSERIQARSILEPTGTS
ncbi:unnamed protein product [Parnassius apollo]|uniref:(apollo) hypothetical protein n=1 Tax=Parnassius apollo TaxID=110799 RepID=A0A8S3WYA8_PARAO|nr:unnamed protein product [Parnassius apollo]